MPTGSHNSLPRGMAPLRGGVRRLGPGQQWPFRPPRSETDAETQQAPSAASLGGGRQSLRAALGLRAPGRPGHPACGSGRPAAGKQVLAGNGVVSGTPSVDGGAGQCLGYSALQGNKDRASQNGTLSDRSKRVLSVTM